MTRYEGFKFCFIFLFFSRFLFSFCSFCCGTGLPHISSYRLKRDCWIYWWGLCVCMCSWCSVLYKSKQQTTSTAWCSYLNVSFFPFPSYSFLHSVSFDWRLDIDVLSFRFFFLMFVPIDGVSYISSSQSLYCSAVFTEHDWVSLHQYAIFSAIDTTAYTK